MKLLSILSFLLVIAQSSFTQTVLYSKAYGDSKNKAIIFLHGGPGYNAVSFEYSTAEKLANEGYYVIVYDQRGCGRSGADENALYTFNEAFEDLNNIYTKYNVKTATLIGHSFGGTVAIGFAEKFPGKVDHLILVGSPISYQLTFKTIISKCKKIYTETKPSELKFIEALEHIDTTSLQYSSYCFSMAMKNGFYTTKNASPESIEIRETVKKTPQASYLSNMTREPVHGFYKNEHYTTLNLSAKLYNLRERTSISGVYGNEDGLFDAEHLSLLQAAIGADKFKVVTEASHNVFLDQQTIFIGLVNKAIRKK